MIAPWLAVARFLVARGCLEPDAVASGIGLRAYGLPDTVTRMKTTIELPDALACEARELAAREKTTLRELVEAGLRAVLRERRRVAGFRLRDASFRGEGLQPEFRGASWDRVREAAYEGRGS